MTIKPDVLDGWLKPQCSRLMYGRCTTLYCLRRGGYTGEPADASIATCEAYESFNALTAQSDAATRMRDACVREMEALRDEAESLIGRATRHSNTRRRASITFQAYEKALAVLESLTLDQVEQEKR